MMLRNLLLGALGLLLASPALAIDGPTIYLSNQAAIPTARTSLISDMYAGGRSTLPTTQPIVASVADPYAGALGVSLSGVYSYTATLAFSQTNVSNLYVPTTWNGNYVIINPGHQNTCSWPAFSSTYQMPAAIAGLLTNHYAVFAENMPNYTPTYPLCGDSGGHDASFTAHGDAAMQLFIEPAVQAMNYWDAHGGNGYYGMMGLSGGGWTTTLLAAVDTRIEVSVPIAGSMPGIHFPSTCGTGSGDSEQSATGYYTIAGYLDQYLMAGNGTGRQQTQILNVLDNCCFGPAQWGTCSTTYGQTWYAYTAAYFRQVQSSNLASSYNFVADFCSTSHQISSCALAIAIAAFNSGLKPVPKGVGLLAS
jgi:hypothetical protein